MADTKTYTGLSAVMAVLEPAPRSRERAGRWSKVALKSLTAVEELLDWLENNGYEEREVELAGDQFVVRWR